MSCDCLSKVLDKSTACECPAAGLCSRHGVKKGNHWHKLCKTRADYFELWEQGNGPGQVVGTVAKKRFKLGDFVGDVIEAVTFGLVKPEKDCGCDKRKRWLNDAGDCIGKMFHARK